MVFPEFPGFQPKGHGTRTPSSHSFSMGFFFVFPKIRCSDRFCATKNLELQKLRRGERVLKDVNYDPNSREFYVDIWIHIGGEIWLYTYV